MDLLLVSTELQRDNRGLLELFAVEAKSQSLGARVEKRVKGLVEGPLRAAQAAGVVRSDLGADDILAVIRMLGAAVRDSGAPHPKFRAPRAFALILTHEGRSDVTEIGRWLFEPRAVTA